MITIVRSSLSARRRLTRSGSLLGTVCAVFAAAVALAGPSLAASPPATRAGMVTLTAPSVGTSAVSVGSLAMTGTSTRVTVHRVYRRAQAQWINHVLDSRLLGLDGCQAERATATWAQNTYRSTVRMVCLDGPARAEATARALVADRPWYRVQVTRVPLIGFGLLADLPEGNDRAVPAALAALPNGAFTFAEGDDLSLNYVGQGVTQAQLEAAVSAFAAALGISPSQVEVTPLAAR